MKYTVKSSQTKLFVGFHVGCQVNSGNLRRPDGNVQWWKVNPLVLACMFYQLSDYSGGVHGGHE
jgi:hypothetical protein